MSLVKHLFGWLSAKRLASVSDPRGRLEFRPPLTPKRYDRSVRAYVVDAKEYNKTMRRHFAAIAEYNRKRSMLQGTELYRWCAAPGNMCDIGAKNTGKIFSYESPPPDGHPCEGKCNSKDWCRCTASPMSTGSE